MLQTSLAVEVVQVASEAQREWETEELYQQWCGPTVGFACAAPGWQGFSHTRTSLCFPQHASAKIEILRPVPRHHFILGRKKHEDMS